MPTYVFTFFLFINLILIGFESYARSFDAEGSDILMGVGAAQMSIGGAAAAGTEDVYSIFWNPAGLAELERNEVTVSKQINSELSPINYFGAAIVSDKLNFMGLKSVVGFAWILRIHAASSGSFSSDELESMFLRFALPGLPGDFDGDLETKAKDYRITWAVMPEYQPKWSLAISLSRIDCRSNFCGVTADDPGNYKISSAEATAYSAHLGAKYFYSDSLVFGLNIEDIDTNLTVDSILTDKNGTRKKTYNVPFPREFDLGLQWTASNKSNLSMDFQNIQGSYGEYEIDFKIMRFGYEYKNAHLAYRGGLIYPLKINSDNTGDLSEDLPFPLIPTVGVGWAGKNFKIDFVIYPHPFMSHHLNRTWMTGDLSVTYRF